MRAAPPPVELSLGSGRRERAAVALMYALAAGAVAGWLLQWLVVHGPGLAGAIIVPAIVAAAALGFWLGWLVLPPLRGRLRWDGAGWTHLSSSSAAAQPLKAVQLRLDLGNWLLLRVSRPDRRSAGWCGITAQEAGAAWHGLRLALYHRVPDGAARRAPS